jgi:hypothetical protein
MLPTRILRARRRAGLRIILRSFGSELVGAMMLGSGLVCVLECYADVNMI